MNDPTSPNAKVLFRVTYEDGSSGTESLAEQELNWEYADPTYEQLHESD